MRFFLNLGCLLMLALIAPISLPAGGAIQRKTEIISHESTKLCLAGNSCEILSSPYLLAPKLCKFSLGTPLRIIRLWHSVEGSRWVQVQLRSPNAFGLPSVKPTRGWINV